MCCTGFVLKRKVNPSLSLSLSLNASKEGIGKETETERMIMLTDMGLWVETIREYDDNESEIED